MLGSQGNTEQLHVSLAIKNEMLLTASMCHVGYIYDNMADKLHCLLDILSEVTIAKAPPSNVSHSGRP